MAKKTHMTFQKREKERARQQKQHDKAQRRLAAKAQRASNAPHMEDDTHESAGMSPGPHALPARGPEAHPTDGERRQAEGERMGTLQGRGDKAVPPDDGMSP
jgi:hypothetical protein